MKIRILLCVAIMAVGLALGIGPVAAQSTSPTPTATPTPGACSISTLPDGSIAYCNTGAENPPSFLGVSGSNINSVSIDKSGNVTCCSGTFGALVTDSNNVPYVLSTSHVLARNGGAKVNEAIVQPGLVDTGCWQDPTDTVAALSKWSTINFKKGQNQIDAALAKVVPAQQTPAGQAVAGIDPLGRIFNYGGGASQQPAQPGQISSTPFPFDNLYDGMFVMKMGRGSCLTSGAIDAWDAMGVVNYPATCNAGVSGIAFFDHQLLVIGQAPGTNGSACSFASQGDSGAVVVTQDFACPQAVGVLFAAASGAGPDAGGQIAAVNPMENGPQKQLGVLAKFDVTLVGKQCTSTAFEASVGGAAVPHPMSAAMRASVEAVRKVKDAKGRALLRNPAVVAVGIGAADVPDTAALKVYLRDDTPAIRARVLKHIKGVRVRFRHAQRFKAL